MRRRFDPHALLLGGLVLGMVALVLRLSLVRAFNQDEFEAFHSGWKVFRGERPYFDFFQHHHPWLYGVIAAVIAALGEGVPALLATRVLHWLGFVAMLALTAAIGREVFPGTRRLPALALLATTIVFVEKAFEIRPDVLQSAFCLAAILLFMRHERSRRAWQIAVAGACLGVSFMLLQKALFAIALLGLLGLARVAAGRMRARDLGLGLAALVAVLAPDYATWALRGELPRYFALNWRINVPVEDAFDPVYGMMESYTESTVLWIAWLVGLPLLLRSQSPRARELALLSMGLVLSLFVVKRPWPQYYMLPVAVMALVAGRAVETAFARSRAAATAVLLLGAVPGAYHFGFRGLYTNERQLRAVEWALAAAGPEEPVHDGRCAYNLFREDLDWFWFSVRPGQMLDRYRALLGPYAYDAVALVAEKRPRIVESSTVDLEDPRIAEMYEPSEEFKNLWVLRETGRRGRQR